MRKKILRLVFVLAAVLVLATACGDKERHQSEDAGLWTEYVYYEHHLTVDGQPPATRCWVRTAHEHSDVVRESTSNGVPIRCFVNATSEEIFFGGGA